MLLMPQKTCGMRPAVSEPTLLPLHFMSHLFLSTTSTLRYYREIGMAWPVAGLAKKRPAEGQKTLANATSENILLQYGECICAPAGRLMSFPSHVLHPSPTVSVLCISHQRQVLILPQRCITNLLLEKAFHGLWSSFKSAAFP